MVPKKSTYRPAEAHKKAKTTKTKQNKFYAKVTTMKWKRDSSFIVERFPDIKLGVVLIAAEAICLVFPVMQGDIHIVSERPCLRLCTPYSV